MLLGSVLLLSCDDNLGKIKPVVSPITESIYASGLIKSKDQYQAFAVANGIIDKIFVEEGDSVKVGTPILGIFNEAQRLNRENAQLAAGFNDVRANQGKLDDARQAVELARNRMKVDSSFYSRQMNLWQQQIGTKANLEEKGLIYQNSKTAYHSALLKLEELRRQLEFSSLQAKKNLMISSRLENDYVVRSEIDGIVFDILKSKGELVGPQTPLAVIGDPREFVLEMQVDEYDIFKVDKGLKVLVSLDSYKGRAFEAEITRVYPIMNERSKTFLVEARFVRPPEILYPHITFEANIILRSKENALLIPRNCMLDDSTVIRSDGERVKVSTGLKDLEKVEIISGITEGDELIVPGL